MRTVTERTPVPFASKVKTIYNGQETGVMHACGHDSHIAILLGTAEVLSSMKAQIKGTIKFIFQPAEKVGPGEEGGARLMVKEGVLLNPKVDVILVCIFSPKLKQVKLLTDQEEPWQESMM
jgi:amidohydrolase